MHGIVCQGLGLGTEWMCIWLQLQQEAPSIPTKPIISSSFLSLMPQSVLLRQTMLLQQSHAPAAHSRPAFCPPARQRRRLRVSARLAPPKVVVSEHSADCGSSIQLAAGTTTAAAVTSSAIGPHANALASKHRYDIDVQVFACATSTLQTTQPYPCSLSPHR